MQIEIRRSVAITTIAGIISSLLLVIAPAQVASAAFRPISNGGLAVTSIANQKIMTDPVTGVRNFMAGIAGDKLTILGSGFSSGLITVNFLGNNNPIDGTNINVISDVNFEVTVPAGVTTGLIQISDGANTVTSLDVFQIWSGRSEAYVMPDGHLNITVGDLKFILDQIKFSEAFANRTANTLSTVPTASVVSPYDTTQCMSATDFISAKNLQQYGITGLSNTYLYESIAPWGLRQVDGRCNNISIDGNGNYIKRDWGATDTLFKRIEPQVPSANGLYSNNGNTVTDATPRLISNLISDQSDANPAAVSAAEDTAGILGTSVSQSNSVNATTGAISTVLNIPNVTSDYNTSAGYNSWFTLFGQFFDHGLDLIPKGDPAYVLIPLERTDPLYVQSTNTNFMILTRGASGPGGTVPAGESINITTPYIDQSQSYGSHPSQNVFLREYSFAAATGLPTDTGRLLDGTDDPYTILTSAGSADVSLPSAWVSGGARTFAQSGILGTSNGGLPTWRDIKSQSLLLGFRLTDYDANNIPVLATDQFGTFKPCTTPGRSFGFPMMLFKGTNNMYSWVCGNPDAPVATSFDQGGVTWNSVNTNHNFINDTANNAVPYDSRGVKLIPDADLIVNTSKAAGMVNGYYDNESLDAHFVAGDGRINENIGLASMHHVFHGEHNLVLKDIQDLLIKNPQISKEFFSEWNLLGGTPNSPKWNGKRLYQAARVIMEMEYQHMSFDEFIRRISPSLQPFLAYDPATDPSITAEFASSVYRLGHSMLNETIARSVPGQYYDNTENQDLSLIDAFTSPIAYRTQKPITVISGQVSSDQTITYTVQNSLGTFSPSVGQVVTISGFEDSTNLNISNALVSESTPNSFTINARYPGGAAATAVPFAGLTPGSAVFGRTAGDGSYVSLATITDPNGQFSFTPAAAAVAVVQGMTAQRGNEIDEFVTDAVRNNLLGLPLDLAALNISRGRDTLLPTLNQFRDYLRTLNIAPVAAYPSWIAYGNKMRHFDSLTNFIAAYGTHPTITSHRLTTVNAVSSTSSPQTITYSSPTSVVGAIEVGDVVSVTGLAASGLNKNWAYVSAVNGNTFTVNGSYASDPSAPTSKTTAAAMAAFMSPPAPATAFSGLTDISTAVDSGFVTRRTTTPERRAAAALLIPSDIKSATMNQIKTGTAPVVTTTTITYSAINSFKVGDRVKVRYALPLAFNQTATVVEPTSQNSFTVILDTNPPVVNHYMGGRATLEVQQADAEAFINSQAPPSAPTLCDYPTGPTTCINWANTESGMNSVDLWIGGLAESPVTQPISPEMLPATFDFVFTAQMLALMNGDRLYYLSRLAGTNLGDEIAGQKFANIILRNTPDKSGTLPNNAVAVGSTGGLKATPDFIFGIGDCIIDASTYTVDNPGCPNTFLDPITGTITHTPVVLNTVMVNDENCINGETSAEHRLQAGGGDDVVWGGMCKDFLRGGIGGDMLVGQGGDDIIFGEGGDDVLQGGPGNDFIDSGDNVVSDIADGGSGKDFISAGAGMGVFAFSGEAGDDFLIDGVVTPFPFNGGDGNDWVQDGAASGVLGFIQGDSGPNVQLNNTLDGGADVIMAGPGSDISEGGSGDDIFLPGDGIDVNWGDEGFDFASYEYRNPTQDIFADLSVAIGNPIGTLPDVFFGVEGLSGSNGNDLLASDSAADITIPNASGTIGLDLIYITTNSNAIRINQQISGIGIPAHTFVVAPPALVPGIATPTYAITISNMLTASFSGASIQVHGWPLTSPEYITGLSAMLSDSPSWNKRVTNVNVVNFTNTVGTSTGNYLLLDRAIGWITEGSTISIGGNQLVDSTGAPITVTSVNAEAISLSATPTVLPASYPAIASFSPTNSFSGGNILLGGAGDDILYSQGADNVIDGEAYIHACISVTNADGSPFTAGADVPCGTGLGYSNLNILNDIAGQGLISPLNMNIIREIKYPSDVSGNPTSCGYTCNTLIYPGAPNQYRITPMVNPLGEIQYLQITKPDGVDIVRNVKTIQFGLPVINGLKPMADIWANLCLGGVACLTLTTNYPPISSTCLSICPGPNLNAFAPPVVASITPTGGNVGTVVTITGNNFRTAIGGTTVTFAGIQATNVNVIDTMSLTCVVPAGVISGQVVVTTFGGSGTAPNGFTVVPAPTITTLSTTAGTSGSAVNISGTNLTYLTAVDINGAPAIIRTQTSTTIGITVPDDATTGPIHVITTSGTATSASFSVRPNILSFAPLTGARGSSVTITGTNFTGTTSVTVGGVAVAPSAIRVISPTSLMITLPVTAATGRIVVTNAGGSVTSLVNYTVVLPPTISSFTPTSGPAGTSVTVTGTVLTGASLVRIGKVVVPITAVTGTNSVRFTIPTGATLGAQKISITTLGGTVISTNNFTVTNPAPTISTFTPNNGGGFATVRITGTNFSSASAVKFGRTSVGAATGTAASFKVISPTLIIADVPSTLTTATHFINVTNAGGSTSTTGTFSKSAGLAANPTVTSFTPATGSVGTAVTITVPGTSYLASLVAVKFGAISAPFTITSATTILTAVPAGATTGRIQLVYPGTLVANGNSFTVSNGAALAPTVTSFSPNQASIGATIIVTGTNLAGVTGATFNAVPVSFKVISATSISFIVPAGAITGTLRVVTPGGSAFSTATVSIL